MFSRMVQPAGEAVISIVRPPTFTRCNECWGVRANLSITFMERPRPEKCAFIAKRATPLLRSHHKVPPSKPRTSKTLRNCCITSLSSGPEPYDPNGRAALVAGELTGADSGIPGKQSDVLAGAKVDPYY